MNDPFCEEHPTGRDGTKGKMAEQNAGLRNAAQSAHNFHFLFNATASNKATQYTPSAEPNAICNVDYTSIES